MLKKGEPDGSPFLLEGNKGCMLYFDNNIIEPLREMPVLTLPVNRQKDLVNDLLSG
ncbi:MAG: hypothetical protein Q7V19_05670 [Bacteroidales bacterium]|nr:hypothetical protein [Bacteroidales bacterium]MDP2236643.1 hypothetical protein [Bacteroidales bacterium]